MMKEKSFYNIDCEGIQIKNTFEAGKVTLWDTPTSAYPNQTEF